MKLKFFCCLGINSNNITSWQISKQHNKISNDLQTHDICISIGVMNLALYNGYTFREFTCLIQD